MKNLLKSLVLLIVVGIQFSLMAPGDDRLDCAMLHNGTFTYTDSDGSEVIVVIDGDSYVEYYKDRKYTLERKLEWVDDCQFNALFVKSNLPNLSKIQTVTMNLKVDRIEGNFIYYTASVKSVYKGSFKKLMEGDYTK